MATTLVSIVISVLFWLLSLVCESVMNKEQCSYVGVGPYTYISELAAVVIAFNLTKEPRDIESSCAELVTVAYLRAVGTWLIDF